MFNHHVRRTALALFGAALVTSTAIAGIASAAPAPAPALDGVDGDGNAGQQQLFVLAESAADEDLLVYPVLKFPDVTIEARGWEQVGNDRIHVKFTLRNLGGAPAPNIHLTGTCNYLAGNTVPEMSRQPYQIGPGSTIQLAEYSMYWVWMVCPKTMASGGGLLDNGILEAEPLPAELRKNNNVMIVDVYNYQPTQG